MIVRLNILLGYIISVSPSDSLVKIANDHSRAYQAYSFPCCSYSFEG